MNKYSLLRNNRTVLLCLVLVLSFFNLYSADGNGMQSSVPEEDIEYLDYLLTLKITSGSFLDLKHENSPVSMTIITRDMIKLSGARNMSELLEIYVPGFQYMFNKWNGTLWGLRGVTNDRNTKIIYLINGHKMNTQARDGFQGETVLGLMKDIERIEVLRGPAGLVYGSGAIAGIVNVITKKATENKLEISTNFGTTGLQEYEANIYAIFPESDQNISISAGFRKADGLNPHQSRIYGLASWPYPANNVLYKNGIQSDGSYGSTDGDWKIAGQWGIKDFNLYFRITRQKESAGGWFILDPWPEHQSNPEPDFESRFVEGRYTTYDEWDGTETWRSNRRQYISDNVMINGRYDYRLGMNELIFDLAYDRNTTRAGTEKRIGYESDYYSNRVGYIEETFGESRITASAMYQLKSVPGFQFSSGIEYRLDMIGEDMYGKNEKGELPGHPVVDNVDYNTISLFGEGLYDINNHFGIHFGGRLDFHTRAFMANPKLALIYKPSQNHSVKIICQSSSNNGSADNYEYNRHHYMDDGTLRDEPYFERPYAVPSTTTDLLQPAQPLDTLHKLKPEKVLSAELAYAGKFFEKLTLTPSLSYGYVKDLFGWSQKLFRVINAGSYQYVNFDMDTKYETKIITIGANHTFGRPVNTDVKEQGRSYKIHTLDTNDVFYDSVLIDGEWYYKPVPDGEMINFDVNLIRDGVTLDGENFLNLNTHITKVYINLNIGKIAALHTNLRLFWGLWGRNELYDKDSGYNYWNIADRREELGLISYLKKSVSKKWNASLHLYLPRDVEVSFFAFDILGIDRPGKERMEKYTINTLRWQQMADHSQKDLYSTDQSTFGVRIVKFF